MKPRGRTKLLIEAMQASHQTMWAAEQCADIMEIERKTVNATLAAAVRNGWLHKIPGEGRAVFYSLQAPAAEQEEFKFTVHSDGDVDLFGVVELENGGYRLTRDMVAELKKFIAWIPA